MNKIPTKQIPEIQLAYVVRCHSVGNPDFGQNANLPMSMPEDIPCETLRECSKACIRYIRRNDLGSGNWSGGVILHPTKGQIANVSYNGRIWRDDGKKKKVLLGNGSYQYINSCDCSEEITTGLDEKV